MNPDDLPKTPRRSASSAWLDYASKLDVARQAALGPLSQTHEIARHLRASEAAVSSASAALRLIEKERGRFEEVRRMVEPFAHFQEQFLASSLVEKISAQASIYQPMLDRIAQLGSVTSAVDEMRSKVSDYYTDVYRQAIDELSSNHAFEAFTQASAMAQKWQASTAILGALSSIDSIKSNFEKLAQSSPVWAQAVELASSLDVVSVGAFEASASNDDVGADITSNAPDLHSAVPHRQSSDLIALVGVILGFVTLLFTIQQAISGGRWQAEQTELARQQLKALQSMQAILEKSVREDERRRHQIFVVKDRPALVRSSPHGRSSVLIKLEPGQVIKPVDEHGKWLEVEYLDRQSGGNEIGWVLKKYLRRVHRASDPATGVRN